jgi:hypothetical protein
VFEDAPASIRAVLDRRILDLDLSIEGSPIERHIHTLYDELGRKGFAQFRPPCYLTDEWGCPSGEPVIGIPFYLADRRLMDVERRVHDLETPREILMYLRHEAGHALNYAYRLYRTAEWRELFGPYHRPYRDHYHFTPFSRNFVRHIPGWYAQKHPDEDFAETFAVWLTPRSNWRRRYRGWPALRKLQYIDRLARRVGTMQPVRRTGRPDVTVEDLEMTVGQFYERALAEIRVARDISLGADLEHIFVRYDRRRKHLSPASAAVRENRECLANRVAAWTGISQALVRSLLDGIMAQCDSLHLCAVAGREDRELIDLTTFVTTLAMNYIASGKFTSA